MKLIGMSRVCIYLRKSRADIEAEQRGEGETLAKHKKALLKLAKQLNLTIVTIREEIVSGEFIDFRPEMQALLKEVEAGEYDAVMVMDVDRFGRGNMQEQGLILDTFRMSKTKIITPRKTYDLSDEFDEEYSEFEAFMARKELKIITRRLQGGRIRSVEEGNYIATRPPYGYNVQKDEHGDRILVPNPEQAPVVKMIFEWYAHHQMGSNKIANELNRLSYKTYSGKAWEPSTVLSILKNAVYIGRLQWGKKEQKKSKIPGKRRDTRTRPQKEWIDVVGKHQPIIEESVYYEAQERLKGKYHVPFQLENGKPKISSPLAGLIRCDMCGASMVYRPYTISPAHLMCYNSQCPNKSSEYTLVEEKLLQSLEQWLAEHKLLWSKQKKQRGVVPSQSVEFRKNAVASLQKELVELEKQQGNLHDLLERGTYTEKVYLERSQLLADRIQHTQEAAAAAETELELEIKREVAQKEVIPKVENVLKTYRRSMDPIKKNALLKSILMHATYRKEKHQRKEQFTLVLQTRPGKAFFMS